MKQEYPIYEEWLSVIANTHLVYNTDEELEQFFGVNSIRSNNIKRCFSKPQKLRAAFRDLKEEVGIETDGFIDLEQMMEDYKKTSTFFRQNLHRRKNPQKVAWEFLSRYYPPYDKSAMRGKKAEIYNQIIEQEIDVPLLIMMLLKVLPGYNSTDGEIKDMSRLYEDTLQYIEGFTGDEFSSYLLPLLTKAREARKSRLTLYSYLTQILDTYETFANPENLYGLSDYSKTVSVDLDIEGFWNECKGEPITSDFWYIEHALQEGTYFMTHYTKKSDNLLTAIRLTLHVIKESDRLIFYFLHPKAIMQRIKGNQFGDSDQVWYQSGILDSHPSEMQLLRRGYSAQWPFKAVLSRCSDGAVKKYEEWINDVCKIENPFKHLEYEFYANLYAITKSHLYIPSENDGEFYKVPRNSMEGFENIKLDDMVGTLTMDGKVYLAFDEFLLYIATTKSELRKYGIERVDHIE